MSTVTNAAGVLFTMDSAKRIAAVVRAEEQKSPPAPHGPLSPRSSTPFLAQITGQSNTSAGAYSWSTQNTLGGKVVADPTSINSANLSTNAFTAFELNNSTTVAAGTNVHMQFAGFNASNTSCYVFTAPGGSNLVLVSLTAANGSTGIYSGQVASGAITGVSGNSISGLTLGTPVTFYNGVEIASPSPAGFPYIDTTNQPVVIGLQTSGTDPTSGLTIVVGMGVTIGCTSNASSGSYSSDY